MYTLYHHYDKHDNLLYIGVTSNLKKRNYGHKSNSPWFKNVTRIECVKRFRKRELALKEEARQIRTEVPCFNSAFNIKTEYYDEMSSNRQKRQETKRIVSVRLPMHIYTQLEKMAKGRARSLNFIMVELLTKILRIEGAM